MNLEPVRFVAVGIVNTAIGYSTIFLGMYGLGLSPETSNVLGYGVGLCASFLLHRKFTFLSKGNVSGEFLRFLVCFAIAYTLNLATLVVCVRVLGVHPAASQIVAGAAYVLASYILSKFVVFSRQPS